MKMRRLMVAAAFTIMVSVVLLWWINRPGTGIADRVTVALLAAPVDFAPEHEYMNGSGVLDESIMLYRTSTERLKRGSIAALVRRPPCVTRTPHAIISLYLVKDAGKTVLYARQTRLATGDGRIIYRMYYDSYGIRRLLIAGPRRGPFERLYFDEQGAVTHYVAARPLRVYALDQTRSAGPSMSDDSGLLAESGVPVSSDLQDERPAHHRAQALIEAVSGLVMTHEADSSFYSTQNMQIKCD